jgi:hypothetical protein
MTVWMVVLLGLFRRVSYVNLLEKLVGTVWTRRHWDSDGPPSSTALTKARDRIGVQPLRLLYERSAQEWISSTQGWCLHGRRVYALDGKTLKTPDTPKNSLHWKRPGASRGQSAFPQMRAVCLSDVGTRLTCGIRYASYRSSEVMLCRQLLSAIQPGSIVTKDRNFGAYDVLWDIVHQRGADFIVRLKKNIKPRVLKRLRKGDEIVEVEIPRSYRRTRPDIPRIWRLRLITYVPKGGKEEIRILTSLTNKKFTKKELIECYRWRWEEETVTDEIKTHLLDGATVNRAVSFRSWTPERVEQELYGILIGFNVVRKIMVEAAKEVKVSPLRISFVSALERLREAIAEMGRLPTVHLPFRYKQMLTAIGRIQVPRRPERRNPREVKIKMSNYPLKRRKVA